MSNKVYAVAINGRVVVNTAYEHARGAMNNYLALRGAPQPDTQPDESIRKLFLLDVEHAAAAKVLVCLVEFEVPAYAVLDPATVVLAPPPAQ